MKKIINSFLYGSSKTKSYLWVMLLFFLGAAGFIISAAVYSRFSFGLIGTLLAALDFIIFQSVSFKEIITDGKEGKEKKKKDMIKKENGRKEQKEEKDSADKKEEKDDKTQDARENSGEEKEKEDSVLQRYDEKEVKKIMHTYKVKKEHKKIMIDLSTAFHIHQCPAYVWKEKGEVRFLLLEKMPRIVKIPLDKIRGIRYEKMVEAKPSMEYTDFLKPCLITKLFSEYLPKYKEANYRGKRIMYKNLYIIAPDIKITSTSVRNLFDLLEVKFTLSDEVTNSSKYSEYYKEAYRSNVLWKDEVIKTSEYQERIRIMLTRAVEEKISGAFYDELLNQLTVHKLITEEYANYYREIRRGRN